LSFTYHFTKGTSARKGGMMLQLQNACSYLTEDVPKATLSPITTLRLLIAKECILQRVAKDLGPTTEELQIMLQWGRAERSRRCIHKSSGVSIGVIAYTHMHRCIHAYVTYVRTYVRTYMHACMHVCIYTCIATHIHIHVSIHKVLPSHPFPFHTRTHAHRRASPQDDQGQSSLQTWAPRIGHFFHGRANADDLLDSADRVKERA